MNKCIIIKKLFKDLTNFFEQYKSIEPFLKRKDSAGFKYGEQQFLQLPHDRAKLVGLYKQNLKVKELLRVCI